MVYEFTSLTSMDHKTLSTDPRLRTYAFDNILAMNFFISIDDVREILLNTNWLQAQNVIKISLPICHIYMLSSTNKAANKRGKNQVSKTVFINLFWFTAPFFGYKTIRRHLNDNLLVKDFRFRNRWHPKSFSRHPRVARHPGWDPMLQHIVF